MQLTAVRDCRSNCGGDLGLIVLPGLAGNCITSCEVLKASSCGVKWRFPSPAEAIQSVFKGSCAAPFEGIVAPVIANCTNWAGRLDKLELIDQAKQLLLKRHLLKAGDFAGVEIRWCPLPKANGMVPRPNTVYLDISLRNMPVEKRAEVLGHEMIHVKQFRTMGDQNFRCEYGRTYLDCGRCQDNRHFMEREAYNFEAQVRNTLESIPPNNNASDCANLSTSGDPGVPEGGKAEVDADGNGCSDFCRVVGSAQDPHVLCTLTPRGAKDSPYKDVMSKNLGDWGHHEFRYWVDVNSDGRSDYCRVVGGPGSFQMWCTLMEGNDFGQTIKFPGSIDRGFQWSGFWLDVDSNGFPDFCRSIGNESSPTRECLLSNGSSFIRKQGIP
jgi:hypothetical protein